MTRGGNSSDCDGRADSPAAECRRASPIRTALSLGTTAVLVLLALASNIDWLGWPGEIVSDLGWRFAPVGITAVWLQRRRPLHAAVSLIATLALMLPTLVLSPRAPAPGGAPSVTIRVLVANLLSTNDETEALLAMLAETDADVLVLMEPPVPVNRALRSDTPLAARFADISRTRPERGEHAPIIVASQLPVVEAFDTDAGTDAVILRSGSTSFGLIATQLLSPRTPARNNTADAQAVAIARMGQTISRRGLPLIIAGDFNASPTGHRSRRLALATGTVRAKPRWRLAGTWPARLPAFVAVPIDGAMVSSDISVARWEPIDIPGSDHRGVLMELTIPPRSSETPRE